MSNSKREVVEEPSTVCSADENPTSLMTSAAAAAAPATTDCGGQTATAQDDGDPLNDTSGDHNGAASTDKTPITSMTDLWQMPKFEAEFVKVKTVLNDADDRFPAVDLTAEYYANERFLLAVVNSCPSEELVYRSVYYHLARQFVAWKHVAKVNNSLARNRQRDGYTVAWDLTQVKEKLDGKTAECRQLKSELASTRSQLTSTRQKLGTTEAAEKEQQREVNRQKAITTRRDTRIEHLEELMSKTGTSELRKRIKDLEDQGKKKNQAEMVKQGFDAEKKALEKRIESLENSVNMLTKAKEAKEKDNETLKAERDEQKAKVDELEEEIRQLKVDELEQQLRELKAKGKGRKK